jgi:hypothetical protein
MKKEVKAQLWWDSLPSGEGFETLKKHYPLTFWSQNVTKEDKLKVWLKEGKPKPIKEVIPKKPMTTDEYREKVTGHLGVIVFSLGCIIAILLVALFGSMP